MKNSHATGDAVAAKIVVRRGGNEILSNVQLVKCGSKIGVLVYKSLPR